MSAITISNLDSNDTFQSDTELVSLARQNDRDAFGSADQPPLLRLRSSGDLRSCVTGVKPKRRCKMHV